MDDIVLQAMAKWPNVPSVYGWLALDRRGNWLIKGETIGNPQLNAFISRNYAHDDQGRWFFQNGPQRVYVALAYAPLVYVVPEAAQPPALLTHTRAPVREVRGAWIDEHGTLLLDSEHGAGHVHDQDLELLLPCFVGHGGQPIDEDTLETCFDALATGATDMTATLWFQYAGVRVKIATLHAADAPRRFGFDPEPREPPNS